MAEEKKAKKLEKKARKIEIRALSKAMDRLATMSSSEAEPGIKEMFCNELAEDDAIDQVDERKNPQI
jgi:hypothetical protein